ncbi:redoxin domain-containing protein [Nonlabens sp. Ci31]|uniref:ABC transporter permease n=1 Tax=Nonlabens sp. Ci31 TaxID=2608253 RepID=UPI0014644B56|nr:ABC transporter permease [Nonlabens sp. Ci31]QJP35605.1 redoxin domain-containing protein [Nonlabens sp. Ci31]
MLHNFKTALQTERIKIKRSGIFTLGFILALIMPLLYFTIQIIQGDMYNDRIVDTNFYFHFYKNPLAGLTGFFLPLLIIITASKIAQIDHKNKGWQLMEMQPISKLSIYFSKFLILCFNVFLTVLLYTVASLFFAWLYHTFSDVHESYDMSLPLSEIGYASIKVFVASLAILAFQYALSVIISGFIWSLVIGFAMLLAQLFLSSFQIDLRWYPHNFLFVSGMNPTGGLLGSFFLPAEWLSMVYTVFFLFVGYHWYRFKGFYSAFAKAVPRAITSLLILAVCSGLAYYLIMPKTLEAFDKTVVKGTISSDKNFKNIYVRDIMTQDTMAVIAVKNNKFRHEFKEELAPQFYNIQFDKYNAIDIFMGANDSIQLKETLYGKDASVSVLGTRISENKQQIFYGTTGFSYVGYQIENNSSLEKVAYYMKEIYSEYEEDLSELKNSISVDHIKAREDFLNRSKKLIAVKHINKWNNYLKKKAIYNPEVPVVLTPDMNVLLSSVSYTDDALLSDRLYFDFIKNHLADSNKEAIDQGKTNLELIADLEEGTFKNKMLFTEIRSQLNDQVKIAQRDSIFNAFAAVVTNDSYRDILDYQRKSLNKLSRGVEAVDFLSMDKDGKQYTLADFKGKYVLIDSWASWCGPCKAQEPYYVKKMIKYRKENIVFVSMNMDEKESNWLEDLTEMNTEIVQLRPLNVDAYGALYNIDSIPRYILIAPDGTIDDAAFTPPVNNAFDDLLDAKLGLNTRP